MTQSSRRNHPLSELLHYLAYQRRDFDRIPTLSELSQELGISVSVLREQLEVARSMGVVEVSPKKGIRRIPFQFQHSVQQSLNYAIAINENAFSAFSDLRDKIEGAYWFQAVSLLTTEDRTELMKIVESAEGKIQGKPAQAPHLEHRNLHLGIYRRLDNPFVIGILESYWLLYEQTGLSVIMDVAYLEVVWRYHRQMVEAIQSGEYERGYELQREHVKLIQKRSRPIIRNRFE